MKYTRKSPEEVSRDELTSRVERVLKRAGMSRFKRPLDVNGVEVELDMPDDLTALNDTKLGILWTRVIRLVSWAKGVATTNDVAYLSARRRLRVARARALLSIRGTREEKAARVEIDPDVCRLEEEVLLTEGLKKLSEAVYQGYEDCRGGVSREITRRQQLEQSRGMGGSAPSRRR